MENIKIGDFLLKCLESESEKSKLSVNDVLEAILYDWFIDDAKVHLEVIECQALLEGITGRKDWLKALKE